MNVSLKSYDASTLDRPSKLLLQTPKVPIIERKDDAREELEKPVPSTSHKALIELRSLHSQRHSNQRADHRRTVAEDQKKDRRSSRQSRRGKRSHKTGSNPGLMREITNPRNLYHNDTVKHLMNQLSELNNFTYGKLVDERKGNESFCSEITLQSRSEAKRNPGNGEADKKPPEEMTRPADIAKIRRSHHVMKLIERQIMRDMHSGAKHDSKNEATVEEGTKTHSEQFPGGMKVVITKTRRSDERGHQHSRQRGESRSKRTDVSLPTIKLSKQPGSKENRRSKPEKYEWSLEEAKLLKREMLPSMNGVKVYGQTTPSGNSAGSTAPSSRQQKSHSTAHADRVHTSLPKIQEEPDTGVHSKDALANRKMTKDVGTNCSPENTERSIEQSPENVKVKLPILGRSIGQQRELNYESGSKFIKPSLREIKRIIHGLYGDYFDSTLGRYYTYENQLREGKIATVEPDTPLHYVTPAWDESQTPAASHTLQLFQSGSKRVDDGAHIRQQSQKISIPLIRSKYGKAIASSNKSADRRLEKHQNRMLNQDRLSYSQPAMRYESHALGDIEAASSGKDLDRDEEPPRISPNTPEGRENTLRSHIAHQVALYHEQIARENRSLGQGRFKNGQNPSRYTLDGSEENETVSGFSKDIDRYAEHILNLESYVEAKRKRSLERKAKLREIKQKQKDKKQQQNRYLEVVEQRDAFLAQVSNQSVAASHAPKTPPNTENAADEVPGDITFEYIHEDHRYDQTPITKIRRQEKEDDAENQQNKQPMGTKIYRIFGDRKKSSTVRRWVAHSPLPFSSRIIKRQVTRSSKASKRNIVIHQPKNTRQMTHYKPRMLTDLVSRFQVATRYKLDRDYVASLASGTS